MFKKYIFVRIFSKIYLITGHVIRSFGHVIVLHMDKPSAQ